MKNISTIFRKEVASFFNSLIAYVVISVFLVGTGLFFWVFEYNILENGITQMDALFDFGPYMFLFLVPAITMRAFSEEMKTGTIEFLFTKPLKDWHIILGKFLAGVFLVFFALLPSIIYYLSTYWLGILDSTPGLGINALGEILFAPFVGPSNLDVGATWGAYIGLFAVGCIFTSLGLLTSALTDNQIVAFIMAVFLSFFFYTGFDFLAGIKSLSGINALFLNLSILHHYESISRGVIDSRDLLYFLSFISVAIILTKVMLSRKMA